MIKIYRNDFKIKYMMKNIQFLFFVNIILLPAVLFMKEQFEELE